LVMVGWGGQWWKVGGKAGNEGEWWWVKEWRGLRRAMVGGDGGNSRGGGCGQWWWGGIRWGDVYGVVVQVVVYVT
jgi:hypothetical protein